MDRIVFLDIDGVIRPTRSEKRFEPGHDLDAVRRHLAATYHDPGYLTVGDSDMGAVYYDWDCEATENLARVLAARDARIILSSDWRSWATREEMALSFRLYGLEQYYAGNLPSYERHAYKKKDIQCYLESHPELTHYAVVDDMDMYDAFGDHFVSTRRADRLGRAEAERVDYLLSHGPWWCEDVDSEGWVVLDGLRRVVFVEADCFQDVTDITSRWSKVLFVAGAGIVLAGAAAAEYLGLPQRRGLARQAMDLFGRMKTWYAAVDGAVPGDWDSSGANFLPDQVLAWTLRRPALEEYLIVSTHKPEEWGERLSENAIPLGWASDDVVTRILLGQL